MLLYPLKDYNEFKELFGLREHDNGTKSRKNQILLSYWKSRETREWLRIHGYDDYMHPKTMSTLFDFCIRLLNISGREFDYSLNLKNRVWYSNQYKTDFMNGKTEDGDVKSIRYVKIDSGRVYKMKAGKMYRHLILETAFGNTLPEQVVTWLCEELSLEWNGYNVQTKYTLHVDKEFEKIYRSRYTKGDFGSCMTDKFREDFYLNSIKSHAAYLTDENDLIVARAIIYDEVHNEDTNEVLRLCERQYATDGDNMLKQVLVNKLIEGGHIDGYKRVGADCHSPRAFVRNNGSVLNDWLHISCSLDYGETLSYQDSFKWYDMDCGKSYNYQKDGFTHDLATTDDSLIDEENNYDSYHNNYTSSDVVEVYYGEWGTCSEDDLDDFERIDGRYYHYDYTGTCDECGDLYVRSDGYYSEFLDEDFCCRHCQIEAEKRYCEEHADEYVWFNGEALPVDEVIRCAKCDELEKVDYAYRSNITDEYYCCDACLREAEKQYCIDHPNEYKWIGESAVAIEEIVECPVCGDEMDKYGGCYSEILGKSFCCPQCRCEAESQYANEHPGEVAFTRDERWYPISQLKKCEHCGEYFKPTSGHTRAYSESGHWACSFSCYEQIQIQQEVESL